MTDNKTVDSSEDAGDTGKPADDQLDKKLDSAFEQIESRREQSGRASARQQTENKGNGGTGAGGVLAVFLALVAIGIASWPAYELYRNRDAASTAEVQLNERLSGVTSQQEAARRELQAVKSELAGLQSSAISAEALTELQAQVAEQLQGIEAQIGTTSSDWLYAEVEYLVRMANQRVLMERDAASALNLLTAADSIVRDAEGLTAHQLRQALAGDIAALKAVNKVDVQGIYLELSALVTQVPKLARSLPVYEMSLPEVTENTTEQTLFQKASAQLDRAMTRLGSLVDFRRGAVEVKPILPPDEEYYLRQNLIMKLQVAQLALLEGNQQVYETALAEAGDWVSDGFDPDDAGTGAMLSSLERLAGLQVSAEMPDISASLQAARNTLGKFHEAEVR